MAAAAWLRDVIDGSQVLVGECMLIEPARLADAGARFLQRMPTPSGKLEHALLRGLYLELALKCGYALHERFHCGAQQSCGFDPGAIARQAWRGGSMAPDLLLLKWAGTFTHEFEAVHGRAIQIRQWLTSHYDQKLDLKSLAPALGQPLDRARREFHRSCGVFPHEYQRGLRILKAVEMLTFEKESVSAVAAHVGYKSKKDLYRVLWKTFARRPTKLRSARRFAGNLRAAAERDSALRCLTSELTTVISARCAPTSALARDRVRNRA